MHITYARGLLLTLFRGLSSTCTACPVGTLGTDERITCRSCSAGSYFDTGRMACLPCPLNQYGANGACIPCANGTYTTTTGASTCIGCPAGSYLSPSPSTRTCVACAVGYYAPASGASSCLACPAGAYAPTSGASACVACPTGAYAPTSGASACMGCTAWGLRDVLNRFSPIAKYHAHSVDWTQWQGGAAFTWIAGNLSHRLFVSFTHTCAKASSMQKVCHLTSQNKFYPNGWPLEKKIHGPCHA